MLKFLSCPGVDARKDKRYDEAHEVHDLERRAQFISS